MQQWSFDPRDPVFEHNGWKLSVQVSTFENTYGLPPESLVDSNDEMMLVRASRMTWGGGQHSAQGSASFRVDRTPDGHEAVMDATTPERIYATKLIIRGLPGGAILGPYWTRAEPTSQGIVVQYPVLTHTPLVFVDIGGGEYLYFESLDKKVQAKRFAFFEKDDGLLLELIHEDAARTMDNSTRTPTWRFGSTLDPEAVMLRHEAHVAHAFGLQPWETRSDVPDWMREVSLVLTLHGMHWGGYVFNEYDRIGAVLDYVCERIDGRRVLAFLPGWEGRYYWQYGDYRPEPLLGGHDGFARLVTRARDLGVHLMPMFGAVCANERLPGFETWGADADLLTPSGLVVQGNRPDWDGSRSHDPGWQRWLNPGAPRWRRHLVEQVSALVGEFDLPAVFFDIMHMWVNDPRHDVYGGVKALRDELKSRFPDLLIAGEGWYDALGAVAPLSHSMSPAVCPEFFGRYNRRFLHLSAGDPSRNSTGVHELGFNPFVMAEDSPYVIPTLAVVDGTVENAREKVDAVIEEARNWARRYL